MEQWNGRRWCPVKMSQVFLMASFIAENERERQNYVSFWKENGDTYFVKHIIEAIRNGWKPVADRVERQRGRPDAA